MNLTIDLEPNLVCASVFPNQLNVSPSGILALLCKVNVPYNSNSGIYLRGLYEVQIHDSYGLDTHSHHMGADYSRITSPGPIFLQGDHGPVAYRNIVLRPVR